MIGKKIAHYIISQKLGEGGMGEVYLADDTELNRQVALKFLPASMASDPDALARLKREAQAAAALNHPNIITIYEIGRHEDQSYIAMSYIDGLSLSDILKEGISIERSVDIALQVCDGLEKAHQAGIVHRDIKPDNLIIDRDGRVKILDFGLATSSGPGSTSSDTTAGTACYMSPEQIQGEDLDARSDVFSLGIVLYEMLTGKRPFEASHHEAARYAILYEQPVVPSKLNPGITPAIDQVVSKALAKNREERYSSASQLAGDLKTAAQSGARPGGRSSSKRWAILLALVLIPLAAFIIVNTLRLEVSTNGSALANENTIAIMYFENLSDRGDPRHLGEIITNLMITNLSQSSDLKVVSSQRLYDILKQLGQAEAKVIDRTTATEVARTAGAGRMMLGSILREEPNLVVTIQLIDVATGNVVSSQRLTGNIGETVFELVDRMSGDTRNELNVPVQLDLGEPKPVAAVTTTSLEAYRLYVEGQDLSRRFYYAEGREKYLLALQEDSTFAQAYMALAQTSYRLGDIGNAYEITKKAARLANRVTGKDRAYLDATMAMLEGRLDDAIETYEPLIEQYPDDKELLYQLGLVYYQNDDYQKALDIHRRVLDLDPLDFMSYNQMAYIYDHLGNFEKSIWAINQYIELAPGDANPYDSRADLYAFNGDIDNAIDSYRKALAIKPDFQESAVKCGYMYIYRRDYERADSVFRELASSEDPVIRSRGRLCLTLIPMYQGRFREALSLLDSTIAADEKDGSFLTARYLDKKFVKNSALLELKEYDRAQANFESLKPLFGSLPPAYSVFLNLFYANLCTEMGRGEEADSILTRYEAARDTLNEIGLDSYHFAKGNLALKKGNPESAIKYFSKALESASDKYVYRFYLAWAYLEAGRLTDAISLLEKMQSRFDEPRLAAPSLGVRAYYLLGIAYQLAGRTEESIEQFQTFVEIWANADPGIPTLEETRRRLAQRKTGS